MMEMMISGGGAVMDGSVIVMPWCRERIGGCRDEFAVE
jgi:hypothetical protein